MSNQDKLLRHYWIDRNQALPEPADYTRLHPPPGPGNSLLWPEGLIAAGADLSATRLHEAYTKGLFPWFSEGQPVLWWSPDPRMVLFTEHFRLHRSLRKTIRQWQRSGDYSISLDCAFERVLLACAAPRPGQDGTWITTGMQDAYCALHANGMAHSVEIWRADSNGDLTLTGGLYGVAVGRMFFGESMFARERDASKIALASLVGLLGKLNMPVIDCQQNTRHLSSLGAGEIPRRQFLEINAVLVTQDSPDWSELTIEFPPV